ncbi:MAG: hypothetical protein Q9163_001308 [Psora crenata]
MHVCAPKNTAREAWAKSLKDILANFHQTADLVFRALVEDWTPELRKSDLDTLQTTLDGVVADPSPTCLNLQGWAGIDAGLERLDGLLRTMQFFLSMETSVPVTVPIDRILGAVDRVLSALPLSSERNERIRPEISRDEREALFLGLPILHISAMHIFSVMLTRFGLSLLSVIPSMLEQIWWTFEHERNNCDIREASYSFTSHALTLMGKSIPLHLSKGLSLVVECCCEDLLPASAWLEKALVSSPGERLQATSVKFTSTDTHTFLNPIPRSSVYPNALSNAQAAAMKLLPLTLTHLPNNFLTVQLRTQVDRAAILIAHTEAMLASAMNPPKKQLGDGPVSSILPLLARREGDGLGAEALLHPQMPVLQYRIETTNQPVSEREIGDDVADDSSWAPMSHPQIGSIENIDGIRPSIGEEPPKQAEAQDVRMNQYLYDWQHGNEARKVNRSSAQSKEDSCAAASESAGKRNGERRHSTPDVCTAAAIEAHKEPRLQLGDAIGQRDEDGKVSTDETSGENAQKRASQITNPEEILPAWTNDSTLPEQRSTPTAIPLNPVSDESDFEIPTLETGGFMPYGPDSEEDDDENVEERHHEEYG